MSCEPTISVQAARQLLQAALELELNPAALCAEAGLDAPALEAGAAEARLPLTGLHALWEAVQARYGRDDLVPRVVQCASPRDYGLVGFLCMSAPTVAAGLELVVKYLRVYTDEPALELDRGVVRVRYTQPLPDRPGRRRATEATLGEVLIAARRLTGHALVPAAFSFAHAAPADRRPLDAFFGLPVRWQAEATALTLSGAQLALPLVSSDAKLHALLMPVARDALERHGPARTLLERARHAVGGSLAEGSATAASVARKLSMTERTFRRRLASEGVGFRALLEQTREALAREYVADPQLPFAEVAYVLGFSEPSAFHRAFKRWTGTTPATFRRGEGALEG